MNKKHIFLFRKFFVKSALPIDDELRKEIGKNIKSSQCLEPPVTLFDKAQAIVEQLIDETTYPNFLKSDMYLQYLEVKTKFIYKKYLPFTFSSKDYRFMSSVYLYIC